MKRWSSTLLLAALLLSFFMPVSAAEKPAFPMSLSAGEGRGGNTVDLTVQYDGTGGALGAFVFRVDFDPACFTFQRAYPAEGLQQNYTTTCTVGEGQAATVYTQKTEELACGEEGDVLVYRFQVREDAPEGLTELTARVSQVLSPQGEAVCEDVEEVLSFAVLGPISSEATLQSLVPSAGELDQPFVPDQLFYTMHVPYEVSSLTFTAVPAEGASCKVNRSKLGAGGSDTEFQITVTAADGKTKQVYQITVHREALSDDASLSGLRPDTGQLDQPFSPDRLEYTMTVPADVSSVTFTATPAEGAVCRANRKNLGAAGSDTEIQITVTAADGKTRQVYRVTVHREEPEPLSDDCMLLELRPDTGELEQAFSPERLSYTMTVPWETTTMTFTCTPVEGATSRVNRKNLGAGGSVTEFQITVTAADGKTRQVYRVNVYREEQEPESSDCTLLSLVPETGQLDQTFSPDRTNYTMTVPFSVKSVTFRTQPAAGASCRVNRKNLGAGGSSTDFVFTVTAADGKTKQTYQVTVYREEENRTTGGSATTTSAKPAASPSPSPSPSPEKDGPMPTIVPVEGEEDFLESSAPSSMAMDELPPGISVESDNSPVYMLGLGALLVLLYLSIPVSRWISKRREKAVKLKDRGKNKK